MRRTRLIVATACALLGLAVATPAHAADPTPAPTSPTSGALRAAAESVTGDATEQARGQERKARKPAAVPTATLIGRATLDPDRTYPGPPSGAKVDPHNGRKGPFPGQVIPGFSGLVDNGDGTFWGQPDNGFGSKDNSADFLLRMYKLTPHWETADGVGAGTLEVGEFISYRDPHHKIPFEIVNGTSADRLLTGADFDIESVQRMPDGTFWVGEEFGPYLLHFDKDGVLLDAPIGYPGRRSPSSPELKPGESANVRGSRGFEALAATPDGRYLYPIVEGSLPDDPIQDRRWILEFDTKTKTYTGQKWAYRTHDAGAQIGDAFVSGKGRIELIERDDFEGPQAWLKRLYRVDLRHTDTDGFVRTELVTDFLKMTDPHKIGVTRDGSQYGVGDPFSYPIQSLEVIVRLKDGSYVSVNDNNYPDSTGRTKGTPDPMEMIRFTVSQEKGVDNGATVIAHRGASGYRPEHTLAAYELAIQQCADFIEPDLVSTKDGVLVDRHEPEISGTTDVAKRPEFADRKTTKTVDGSPVTGWFADDFTLAELKTLRAVERLPQLRGTAYDGLYEVPTFEEVLRLAQRSTSCAGRPVGVYPETKHPTYFRDHGLALEKPLVNSLKQAGWDRKSSPVFIQSFETANLRDLDRMTQVKLVQLVDCSGAPYDLVKAGDKRSYADLVTKQGLKEIARYADGLGACKDVMIPRDARGFLKPPTDVIKNAHKAGLDVHGWTFRAENSFLPADFRKGADPKLHGDVRQEIKTFLAAGMDGFFTDFPDEGAAAARFMKG